MTQSIHAVDTDLDTVAPTIADFLLDESALGLVERLILTTDATVVRFLEACYGERICTAALEQEGTQPLPGDVDLELVGDETVLRRATLLQGARSGRNYVYAESSVVLDRLPDRVREALVATTEPIGRVLIDARVETFRELVRTGRAPAGPRGPLLGVESTDLLLCRTYRVIAGGHPMMVITEHFAPVVLPPESLAGPGGAASLGDGR